MAKQRLFQSTHPVWGATTTNHHQKRGAEVFQSTHPVWGATRSVVWLIYVKKFQSTHPVWGATGSFSLGVRHHPDFNPRTPCGVRRIPRGQNGKTPEFQSTHPVWGATALNRISLMISLLFQSTHPVWGATSVESPCTCTACYFNPRTPCGVRLEREASAHLERMISIHAPRVGCDFLTV